MGLPAPQFRRLLLVAYLLLWVPALTLLLRRSHQPEILGWWSRRALCLALADVACLAAATWAVWSGWRPGSRWLERAERRLPGARRRPLVLLALAVGPPLGGVAAMLYLGQLGVPLTLSILACLSAIAGLVVVWELVLFCGGRPVAEQRELSKRLGLLAGSLLISLLLVEAAGRLLGWQQFASWDINPKALDVRFRTDDFDVRVVTNRQGLREPSEIPLGAHAAARVVIVGDSMTFGWGVDYEDAYPHVTERRLREQDPLRDAQVINCGRPGADPRDYLTFIRRYVAQFRPQWIVVGFLVGNDCPIAPPPRLRSETELSSTLREYLAVSEPLWVERAAEQSAVASLLYRGCYRRVGQLPCWGASGRRGPLFGEPNPLSASALEAALAQAPDPRTSHDILERLRREGWIERGLKWDVSPWLLSSIVLHPQGPADSLVTRAVTAAAMRQEWQLCEGLFREMHHIAASANAQLVILAIPHAHAVSRRWVRWLGELGCEVSDRMTTARTINDWLAAFAAREQIVCVDPLDAFRAAESHGEALYFGTDDHMTPQGHRLLAQALAARIGSQIPSSSQPEHEHGDGAGDAPAERRGVPNDSGSAGASPSQR